MQTGHDRTYRDVHNLGDVLVGEAFDIGVVHHHAEILGEGAQCLTHLGARQGAQRLGLRRTQTHGVVIASSCQLPVLDGFTLTLLRFALTLAVQVDVRIREDAVQPRLQVRTLGELVIGREGLHIGLLHQIFSVGGVAAHA